MQSKTLYWNPARATSLAGNKNAHLYEIESKFKDKLSSNLQGFQRKDIVNLDSNSLRQLSVEADSKKVEESERRIASLKYRQRMD